jgi:hypothetical protein
VRPMNVMELGRQGNGVRIVPQYSRIESHVKGVGVAPQ